MPKVCANITEAVWKAPIASEAFSRAQLIRANVIDLARSRC
jgi:hypothetical protein